LDSNLLLSASTWPASFWWFACAWLFVFGACVGSFLNVVIYRLPAGLSLLYPGSRCPKCLAPIRATDNVPIFGWLLLAGRCRACHANISPRYPAVELVVATLFTLLAARGPLSGGLNLPTAGLGALGGVWNEESLWVIYGYHLTLVCGLLCAALIECDGHPVPMRFNVPLILVGMAVPLLWPEARPVASHWHAGFFTWLRPHEAAMEDGIAGMVVAGLLAGAALPLMRRGPEGRFDRLSRLAVLVWIGLYLGWQATCSLALLTAATQLAAGLAGRLRRTSPRLGWNGCLAIWTLVWIVAWKQIVEWFPFVGE